MAIMFIFHTFKCILFNILYKNMFYILYSYVYKLKYLYFIYILYNIFLLNMRYHIQKNKYLSDICYQCFTAMLWFTGNIFCENLYLFFFFLMIDCPYPLSYTFSLTIERNLLLLIFLSTQWLNIFDILYFPVFSHLYIYAL